ncbi:hypothetical protein EHM69_10690 [candidate division KSB1 bacterium]|nr:MAG: hypothetical protein EHM69_10690 [candidate division KSB1 bacterium]
MSLWSRILIVSVLLIVCAVMASAAPEPLGYYRYPTAFGDQIVFTSEGDLWSAPLSGGIARRLTTAAGVENFALFSPDGKWLAFTGNYDGNVDVYMIPAEGGVPKRLTYHPALDYVAAWAPDGKIVFRSTRDGGPGIWKCYAVSHEGEYPEQIPVDEVGLITYEPNGDRVAYNRQVHQYMGYGWWKRYRGGDATDIWVGSTKTRDYKNVTNSARNETSPMWFGDRIYFMRDNDAPEGGHAQLPDSASARMNIWSIQPDGSDLKQHTFHSEWDARWPTLADGKIAYGLGADIWVFDIRSGQTRKVDVTFPSDMLQTRDKFISPDEYSDDMALNKDGKRLLLNARGELFTAPTERRGVIRHISHTPAAREKNGVFTPDGKQILAWSDLSGEEALYLFPADGVGEAKKLADGSAGWNFAPVISPDGKWAVYGDCRRALQLVDMATGKTVAVDSSEWEIRGYEWSPDSRYIVYSVKQGADDSGVNVIHIYDVTDKKAHEITDPLFTSYSPTWDPQGKWLYFISSRHMNPFSSDLDWSFVVLETNQIFGLALDTTTFSPYACNEDGQSPEAKKDEEKEDENKKDDEKKEEKVEVNIVWDGIQDRIVKLPVDPGNYGGLTAIEGKLYFFSSPTTGWLAGGGDDDSHSSTLKLFDIKTTKLSDVVSGVEGYVLSGDCKKIAVHKKDGFVVMDAGAAEVPEPDKDDQDAGLHLEDWIYDLDPQQEWTQIFNEAWRMHRDFYYDPNMHGVNWKWQRDRYGSLLNRIRTRDELNDLIAQLIGELTSGHNYAYGGDTQRGKSVGVGLLGVNVTRTNDGFYRIDRVLAGDRWDRGRTSPLTGVGMNVKTGEYLVAVNGVAVNTVPNYLALLNNQANRLVTISLNSTPSLDGARKLVVKPIGGEDELRYWDWVYGRMEYVRKNGGDDIAYVHLSDMGTSGMEQWMKEYYTQSGKKALIMDVRHNGGGNIAEWILSQLERSVWSWGVARNGNRYRKASSAFYGPMVALCNGGSGSDGETFSEGWKRLKLGPLAGTRTWGGWVGIRADKPLLDRGFLSQPEFTGWGKESTWLIEGPGVSPDVEVINHPKMVLQGLDEQLDWAINYLKDKMKNEPMKVPPMPPFPDKSPTGFRK